MSLPLTLLEVPPLLLEMEWVVEGVLESAAEEGLELAAEEVLELSAELELGWAIDM
ncbi:MAG TPA: hypothetical protein V6D20_11735 [Candidatus Obscuribacterales bacterium]